MILTDREIRELALNSFVEARTKNVDPFIFPFDEKCVNPTSYDLKIGYTACHLRSPFWNRRKKQVKLISDFHRYSKKNPYWLEANDYILVSARETINIPSNVSAKVMLKSSRAREGMSHALAGWVDSGFNGILTLELKNYLKDTPVAIYPEMRIVQLVFYTHNEVQHSYKNGRYGNMRSVMPSLDEFPNKELGEAVHSIDDLNDY